MIEFEDVVQSISNVCPYGVCLFDPHRTHTHQSNIDASIHKILQITHAYLKVNGAKTFTLSVESIAIVIRLINLHIFVFVLSAQTPHPCVRPSPGGLSKVDTCPFSLPFRRISMDYQQCKVLSMLTYFTPYASLSHITPTTS